MKRSVWGLSILATAVFGLIVLPALARSGGQFGSKLTKNTQPSNGAPGLKCKPSEGKSCTFVMNEAYAPPNPDGKQKAPKDGTIKKISIIAATKGKFRPQIVERKNGKAAVVEQGPRLSYDGQSGNGDTYEIESFKVNLAVEKGQYLGAKAKRISFVRCSSGGDNTLIYQPALKSNQGFEKPSGDDGCWMLISAKYK